VFRLSRTLVREVMVPRDQVIAIEQRIDLDELLDLLRDQGYTRLPVYQQNLDDLIGVLHAKDLFHVYAERRLLILEDVIRPVAEMDPDLPVVDALRQFRRARKHLAVVRRAGGPLLGIVTLEDVLEEIVGEIEDEHDEPTWGAVE
jgi:CBS domain containing-hemolysin-like protein